LKGKEPFDFSHTKRKRETRLEEEQASIEFFDENWTIIHFKLY